MRVKSYRVFFRQISTAATRLQNGLINPTDSDQFTAPAAPGQTTDLSDISDRLRPDFLNGEPRFSLSANYTN